MKIAIAILFLLVTGPYLLWMGVQSLRRSWWRESVPLLEVVIDRVAGIAPPPRTAWDRRFAFAQAIMFTVFGTFFSLVLIAVLFSVLSE